MKNLLSNEYNSYYKSYIELAENTNIIAGLNNQLTATVDFFNSIAKEKLLYKYAPEKWTPIDILQHIIDTERIFCYRALRFSRFDSTNIPGYEENDYAKAANANKRTLESLISEYIAVKNATINFYTTLSEEMLNFIGTANNSNLSARAIGYILVGHEIHHINVIKERYL